MYKTVEHENRAIVKPKIDVAFKRLFTSGDLVFLKSLLAGVLGVEQSEIEDLQLSKTELPPPYSDGKFGRLDINAKVNRKKINVEMQCLHFVDFPDRSLYYWATLYLSDFKRGADYSNLESTICINIVDTRMFDKPGYHSIFKLMDTETHQVLTDNIEIHFLELKKIEKLQEYIDCSDVLKLWLQLLNSETEADLDMLMESGVPEIADAAATVMEMSTDEKIRYEIFLREAQLHDEVSYYAGARREGLREGREEGRKEGRKEGREEGRKEGLEDALSRLIANGITEEEARRLLDM